MNNSKRRKRRITALTLAATLLLSGCAGSSSFKLSENEDNELVAMDGSYIDNSWVNNYYVLEVYNKITKENEILIVRNNGMVKTVRYYSDIFTNLEIEVNSSSSIFTYVKQTSLNDYIVSLGLGQLRYSYDDMKNIYEVIKENYVFENDSSLRKIRTNNSRI